uniref:PIK-related kinase FAT domain-containing protein n=1 Tax=Romanomermis culicivorax TaxID=13658 RepID=A0A915HPX3_ROMCU
MSDFTCPCAALIEYLWTTNLKASSSEFIFRSIVPCKDKAFKLFFVGSVNSCLALTRKMSKPDEPFGLGHAEVLLKTLADSSLRDDMKLKALQEINDNFEAIVTTSAYQPIADNLLKIFTRSLQTETTPQFIGENNTQQLRKLMLEIIHRMPMNGEFFKPYIKSLLALMFKLLEVENEENSLICLRIVMDFHRQFRPPFSHDVQQFLNFIKRILQNLATHSTNIFEPKPPIKVNEVQELNVDAALQTAYVIIPIQTEQKLSDGSNITYTLLPRGIVSLKVLAEMLISIIMLHQVYKQHVQQDIQEFIPLFTFDRNDPNFNREILMDFLNIQVKTMSFFVVLCRNMQEYVANYSSSLAKALPNILLVCPPDVSSIRKELMIAFRHMLTMDVMRSRFTPYLEQFFDEKLTMGTSFTAFDSLRVHIYQTLADFVHHGRNQLTLENQVSCAYYFSKVIFDSTLPCTTHTMALKLLLNIVDSLARQSENVSVKPVIVFLLDLFVKKFREIALEIIPSFQEKCERRRTDSLTQTSALSISTTLTKSFSDLATEPVAGNISQSNIDSQTQSTTVFAESDTKDNESTDQKPFTTATIAASEKEEKLSFGIPTTFYSPGLSDTRAWLKMLVHSAKVISSALSGCKYTAQGIDPKYPTTPLSSLEAEYFLKIVKYGLMSIDVYIYAPGNTLNSLVKVPIQGNHIYRLKEEKEVLEHFASIFALMNLQTFKELFTDCIDYVVERISVNPVLQVISYACDFLRKNITSNQKSKNHVLKLLSNFVMSAFRINSVSNSTTDESIFEFFMDNAKDFQPNPRNIYKHDSTDRDLIVDALAALFVSATNKETRQDASTAVNSVVRYITFLAAYDEIRAFKYGENADEKKFMDVYVLTDAICKSLADEDKESSKAGILAMTLVLDTANNLMIDKKIANGTVDFAKSTIEFLLTIVAKDTDKKHTHSVLEIIGTILDQQVIQLIETFIPNFVGWMLSDGVDFLCLSAQCQIGILYGKIVTPSMEMLHNAMKPLLLEFSRFNGLTAPVAQKLFMLTKLFPAFFTEKLCDQLYDIDTCALIIEIFCYVPSATSRYIDYLVPLITKAENALQLGWVLKQEEAKACREILRSSSSFIFNLVKEESQNSTVEWKRTTFFKFVQYYQDRSIDAKLKAAILQYVVIPCVARSFERGEVDELIGTSVPNLEQDSDDNLVSVLVNRIIREVSGEFGEIHKMHDVLLIGLYQLGALEHRRLSVDVCEMILKWEMIRLKGDTDAPDTAISATTLADTPQSSSSSTAGDSPNKIPPIDANPAIAPGSMSSALEMFSKRCLQLEQPVNLTPICICLDVITYVIGCLIVKSMYGFITKLLAALNSDTNNPLSLDELEILNSSMQQILCEALSNYENNEELKEWHGQLRIAMIMGLINTDSNTREKYMDFLLIMCDIEQPLEIAKHWRFANVTLENLQSDIKEELMDIVDDNAQDDNKRQFKQNFIGLWQKNLAFLNSCSKILAMTKEENKLSSLYMNLSTFNEFRLWEDQWMKCIIELNDWDLVQEYAASKEVSDPFLLVESAWRIPNWSAAKECIFQIEHACPLNFLWKLQLYRGYYTLCSGEDGQSWSIEKCVEATSNNQIKEWRKLPKIVSKSHCQLLQAAQQVVELSEASNLSATLSPTQLNRSNNITEMKSIQSNQNAVLGIHAFAQCLLQFARASRKQGLTSVAIDTLNSVNEAAQSFSAGLQFNDSSARSWAYWGNHLESLFLNNPNKIPELLSHLKQTCNQQVVDLLGRIGKAFPETLFYAMKFFDQAFLDVDPWQKCFRDVLNVAKEIHPFLFATLTKSCNE